MKKNIELRIDALRAVMNQNGLDGYLVVDPINVSYLSGFKGEDSYLWIGDAGIVLLTDSRFEEQVKEDAPGLDAAVRKNNETLFTLLKKAISDTTYSSRLPQRVGIEASSVALSLYRKLCDEISGIDFVARDDDIERLREIKDNEEIDKIRAAIDLSIDSYRMTKSILSNDMSEADIRDELEYRMRRLGADDVSFPSIVAYSARAALPHAIPTRSTRLSESSLVLIDWGAKKDGYVGDLTRAFLTEKGSENAVFRTKFNEVFNVVLDAHNAAIEFMKPGVRGCDVDKIARDAIANAGYGEYFGHSLGHCIGRVVHDFGGLSPRHKRELVPGMVVTVEPGIYLPGWGGVRIEDDVLICENGVEVLSKRISTNE